MLPAHWTDHRISVQRSLLHQEGIQHTQSSLLLSFFSFSLSFAGPVSSLSFVASSNAGLFVSGNSSLAKSFQWLNRFFNIFLLNYVNSWKKETIGMKYTCMVPLKGQKYEFFPRITNKSLSLDIRGQESFWGTLKQFFFFTDVRYGQSLMRYNAPWKSLKCGSLEEW